MSASQSKQTETAEKVRQAAILAGQGLGYPEIAAQLGVPIETVKTWRKRYKRLWGSAHNKSRKTGPFRRPYQVPHSQTFHVIQRTVAMLAAQPGLTLADCARALSVHPSTLRYHRIRYRTLWYAELAKAKQNPETAMDVAAVPIPEGQPDAHIRRGIDRAVRLLARGLSREEAAQTMGIPLPTMHNWQFRYPDLWQRAVAAAVNSNGHKPSKASLAYGRRNSLAAYFWRRFVPEELAGKTPAAMKPYQAALTKLCCFLGHDALLGEVNEALLEQFRVWLVHNERNTEEWARQTHSRLCRIVRHASPGTCAKRRGKRPQEPVAVGIDDAKLDGDGTLWRFYETVYRPEKLAGATGQTAEQYRIAVRRLARQLGRAPLVAEMDDAVVGTHLEWMLKQGYARATANTARGYLCTLTRHAYRKRLVERLPDVPKLREHRRLPDAWTMDEVTRLLEACRSTPGRFGPLPAGKAWEALVLVLYDTGLRHRAAMAIEQDHVDLDTGWLYVPAENQKNRVEQRFRLSPQAVAALRAIWSPPRRLVFPMDFCSRVLFARFRRILIRAGLPATRRDMFHKLRRTTATQIARVAGIEAAARQLGHAASDVTRRYVDPRIANRDYDATAYLPRPDALRQKGRPRVEAVVEEATLLV